MVERKKDTIVMVSKKLSKKEQDEWEQWLLTCERIKSTTKPTLKETSKEQKRRIKYLTAPGNEEAFINYYFATDDFQPAPLSWFQKEGFENVFQKKLRKHIWEWFRESAKSVIADIFVPIIMLAKGDLEGMILAGKNSDKAKNLLKDIEAQLRNNQKLIDDFGDFGITGSWMSSFFKTSTGIGFWSFGLRQDPAGVRMGFKRPNLGIVDDCDNKDDAKNEELTEERVNWINGEFMGCLAKDNRCFIYVNNRVHHKGITARIVGDVEEGDAKDESFAHVKTYLTEHPETHEPLYPSGNTREELIESLEEQGAVPGWKEYYSLGDCVDKFIDYGYRNAMRQLYHLHIDDGNMFTDENMPYAMPHQLQQYDAIVTYCDPAFGETGKGSYKAIVMMGKKGHTYDVLFCWVRKKGDWTKAHRTIAEEFHKLPQLQYSKESLNSISVRMKHFCEANPLQKTELKKTYKILNLKYDKPWYPKYDEEKKADKVGRIEQMEMIADNGLLRFNELMKGNQDMLKLREQMKAFPKGHIDGPDALNDARTHLDNLSRRTSFKRRTGNYNRRNR